MVPIQHVNQLFGLRGMDFISAAYKTVLGREADSQGSAYYAGRLAAEQDRAQILYELAISEEGSGRPRTLTGLPELIHYKGTVSRRSLGRPFSIEPSLVRVQYMVASLGEEANERLRSIDTQLALLTQLFEGALAKSQLAISTAHEAMQESLRAISASLERPHSEMTVATPTAKELPQALNCVLAADSGPEALIRSLAQHVAASAQAQSLSKEVNSTYAL
jgi:Domain of unknown function (DUF4214)